MKNVSFHGRILMIGCGSVARCVLPLLLRHLEVRPQQITVLDFVDCREHLASTGVGFVQQRITSDNLDNVLAQHVSAGDLIVDLAWNIDCVTIVEFCNRHDVLYVNTSVEVWDPYAAGTPTQRTLYQRHMALRETNAWKIIGATAILDHGANPGLVSHFTKRALIDIAERIINEKRDDPRNMQLQFAIGLGWFHQVARLVGVKTIHISELDTQVASRGRSPGEFVNTWSVEGFYEEGTAPAEMGWGTHERTLPHDACLHATGPKNQICLERFGMNTFVRSRVPSREIIGMVIRHGESFSISEFLSVRDSQGVSYRPTVHYAYCPCPDAVNSINELRDAGFPSPVDRRIMGDEITSGQDELGVLLMGHDFKSWWCGTTLDINETRGLVTGQNATTLQVAASVLAAVIHAIKHPRRGVLLPDDLPHEEILGVASPYLGNVTSQPIEWKPEGDWQFADFLIENSRDQNGCVL